MYKTLSKITKARHTIPVLGMVQVKNGVATTTDMDTMIQAPCALKDGMYHGHCFDKNIHILDEMGVDDMPFIEIKGKPVGEFIIEANDIDDLKWVSTGMSTDETRYYLNGIHIAKDGRIVATDGHRLNVMTNKTIKWHKDDVSCIIWRSFVKLFFDLFKELKAETAKFEIYENDRIKIYINEHVMIGKTIDGTYPQFDKVIPTDEVFSISPFSVAEFKAVLPEVRALHKSFGGCQKSASLKCIDNQWMAGVSGGDARLPKYDMVFKPNTEVGFNGVYMSQLIDGVAEVRESAPLVIRERRGKNEKMAVLMPLRV